MSPSFASWGGNAARTVSRRRAFTGHKIALLEGLSERVGAGRYGVGLGWTSDACGSEQ